MLSEIEIRLSLCTGSPLWTKLSGAWTRVYSCWYSIANLSYGRAGGEDRGAEERGEEKLEGERTYAGAAMGRHPLTKRSACDMAFTEYSQMPWQLIKALNASCINTPCTRSWLHTARNIHLHTPKIDFCFHGNNTVQTERCGLCLTLVLFLSQTRTHTEKWNEYITYTITE